MSAVAEKKPARASKKPKGVIEHLIETAPAPLSEPAKRVRLRILLEDLERHPDNRTPSESAIAAVAESMAIEGQLEPLLVRSRLRSGRLTYQVISGETRWRAAERLGWQSLDADVVDLGDAAAMRAMAAANASRQDLNPIEKAKLIQRLCEPEFVGGAGMTRDAAAKMFDLQSGGAASNLVRLLELPDAWQDRVASGELAQSYARELLRVLVLGPSSEAWGDLAAAWLAYCADPTGYDGECFASRDLLRAEVDLLLVRHSRPIESDDTRSRSYHEEVGSYGAHPRRFELTPDLERDLAIVELEIDGMKRRRATNCFLYDQNQVPALKRYLAKKPAKGVEEPQQDGLTLTPRQEAAAEAERREEQAERLAKRIEEWRAAWLRELVAERIVREENADLAIRLAAWLQRQVRVISYGDAESLGLDDAMRAIWDVRDPCDFVVRAQGHGGVEQLVAHWLRVPLRDGHVHPMPDDHVEDMFDQMRLDVADQWTVLQALRTAASRERLEQFFSLHNSDQLDELGRELGVGTSGAAKKTAKVALFMNAPKTLKLPRALRSLRKRGAK